MCKLECSNKKCKKKVYNIGDGFVDYELEYNKVGEAVSYKNYDSYKPKFFKPHLKITCSSFYMLYFEYSISITT